MYFYGIYRNSNYWHKFYELLTSAIGIAWVTNSLERAKNSHADDTAWTELLAQCIHSLGTDEFPPNLIEAVKAATGFDNSVVFSYYKKKKPLCLYHTFTSKQRVVFVDDYLKGPYLLDPFFTACSRKVDTGLYRLRDIAPDRFYQSEYYRSYYVRTGLAEEICYIFYLASGAAVAISLMRSEESSRFSAREFRLLEKVAPIIISMAQRHWQGISDSFSTTAESTELLEDHSLIEKAVSDLFGHRITPRETQVTAQVLEGHSSESISKSLGISVGTVRIHRRNIYAKLRISSQQELFSIFFNELATVHD
jgi:DNA-binding CsgD family transcriptional regulator